MLTSRGRWLLALAALGAGFGLLAESEPVAVVCLAVLLWIGGQWLAFRYRSDVVVRRLRGMRRLSDGRARARTLWVGRTFEVQTHLRLEGFVGIPYVILAERLPQSVEFMVGSAEYHGRLRAGDDVELAYSFRPGSAGILRFEGVTVRLADAQGFFAAERFVSIPQEYRVLPPLIDVGHLTPERKRHNQLPLIGLHHHPRAGLGSELLQLREYVPGDPPRAIAWKVSARRDRLMSKEYESEVPVRCTLFVDVSNAVAVGHPGPTPLARLVELAATLVQSAIGNRDPVGLCLVAERGSRIHTPTAHPRQVFRLLNHLAEAAGVPPDPVACPVEYLIPQAYAFCHEVYPEAFRRPVNRVPFRFFPLRPRRRKQRFERVQLATFLAEYFDLAPEAAVRLQFDDPELSRLIQRFLGDHHVGYHGPLYGPDGRYLFASAAKVEVLARALTRAVGKGHDNELFVILADLLELGDRLAPLLTAIKVAVARHHRVIVVCAWPPGLEPPAARAAAVSPPEVTQGTLAELVHQVQRYRFHTAYQELRATLARLRVPLACAAEERAPRLVLAQLDQLRTGRRVR